MRIFAGRADARPLLSKRFIERLDPLASRHQVSRCMRWLVWEKTRLLGTLSNGRRLNNRLGHAARWVLPTFDEFTSSDAL